MKKWHFFLILLIITVSISAGVLWNRFSMTKWEPTKSQIGKWSGTGELHLDYQVTPYKNEDSEIVLEIHKNGNVSGTLGDSQLIECKITLNRVRFERFLQIKTDYIIKGYIDSKINEHDELFMRKISIPCNIDDNVLLGSIFHIETLKYPYPLIPKLQLTKE